MAHPTLFLFVNKPSSPSNTKPFRHSTPPLESSAPSSYMVTLPVPHSGKLPQLCFNRSPFQIYHPLPVVALGLGRPIPRSSVLPSPLHPTSSCNSKHLSILTTTLESAPIFVTSIRDPDSFGSCLPSPPVLRASLSAHHHQGAVTGIAIHPLSIQP